MRTLWKMIAALSLIAGLLTGSLLHAAETAGPAEVTSATAWLHADGDHDQVPPDADKDVPHHHNLCHGHDLAAPLKAQGVGGATIALALPRPTPDAAPRAAPPASLLRPPAA